MSQTQHSCHIVFSGRVRDGEAVPVFGVSVDRLDLVGDLFCTLKRHYARDAAEEDAEHAVLLVAGDEPLDQFRLSAGASLFLRAFLSMRSRR